MKEHSCSLALCLCLVVSLTAACSEDPAAGDGGPRDGSVTPPADGSTAPTDSSTVATDTSPRDGGGTVSADGWTYDERVVLYLTNRVRTDPAFFNLQWGGRDTTAPAPSPPMGDDDPLQQAARFQAEHIDTECSLCENHASCCVLGHVEGAVQCVEPAESCGGTGPRARVTLWSPHYTTENGAQGTRTPENSVMAWISSGGHFSSMNGNHRLLGVGRSGTVWIQVFGNDGSAPPTFAHGVHYRRMLIEGGGTGIRSYRLDSADVRMFGVTYYAPDAGGPREVYVLVDGERHDLALTHGAVAHGSYEAEVPLGAGCAPYTFHLVDADGLEHVDPPTGHLNAALAMDETCPFVVP
ncbi:MAG: hypothetical protein JRH11_24145 [Deltaproteobacteria bacterium]|nr:hypothetical protein [Deltaproteobacteria bacterium]